MVKKAEKFICGCGVCRLYECEICHALFFSEEDAEKCELSHNAQPTGKGKGR